jgi:hypothetical protein
MKVQIGTLDAGQRILYTEVDDDSITVSRLVVGKKKQDKSGRPVVEMKRPLGKRAFSYVSTDTLVEV